MALSVDLEAFRKHSKLFALMNEAGQQRLLDISHEEAFADGAVLMNEGEGGESFYVLLKGAVRVLIDDRAGGQKEVAKLGAGAFVGEIAALMGEPRSATVVADGEIGVLQFDAPPVQEILNDYPKVREALVKLALKRSEQNLQELLGSD
jgi:CRP-like cAMP-binding protein